MQITQVTITVHEKRNNPFEYGHYDASVTLTAQVDQDEHHLAAVRQLLNDARDHAVGECDRWEEGVRERKRVDDILNSLNYSLGRFEFARYSREIQLRMNNCLDKIRDLPEEMQSNYRDRLASEVDTAMTRIHETQDQDADQQYDDDDQDYDYDDKD